jgi:replicative DNA helicase
MALLGSMIFDLAAIPPALEIVKPAMLHFPAHRTIFTAIARLHGEGRPVDLVILRDELSAHRQLDAVGGADYLMTLVEGVPNAANVGEYAKAVAGSARRRDLVEALGRAKAAAEAGTLNGELAALESAIMAVADDHATNAASAARLWTLEEIRAERKSIGIIPRIATSIPGLDALIGGGCLPGWTVLIAAFTGNGKTSLEVREAIHHAAAGRPTLYVSLELTRHELDQKIEAATEGEVAQDLPLRIVDEVSDLAGIVGVIERWADGVDAGQTPVVLVDFAQLVQSPAQPSREREVFVAVQTLSRLARRRGILLIAAAQLNRASQQEGKPKLHHLRESGGLEQFADLALLLDRTAEDRLWIGVGKARFGGTGKDLELSVDFARCRLAPIQESAKWEPLAAKVVEFLSAAGGRAKMREVYRNVWIGKDHPTAADVVSAASNTKVFNVGNGEAWL